MATSIPIAGYIFDASERTITFQGYYGLIEIGQISLITNTVTGEVIFQFQKQGKLGSLVATVLTLEFDTTSMNDADELKFDIKADNIGALAEGAATEATLSAVLAKIIAAPATESTLGLIFNKLISAPATSAKQDDIISWQQGIYVQLSNLLTEMQLKADLTDTQPVSAASLPLPSGAATEANQATLIAKDFATQTTLAAVLAKIIAAPSTEAKQDTLITALAALLTELQLKADLSETQPVSFAASTKTANTPILSLQSNAATTVLISGDVDVSAKVQATIYTWLGRRSATAAGAGCNIRIEGSPKTSGGDTWIPLAWFTSSFAAVEAEAVTGTVNAAQKVITVASTTNLTAGDYIYIDNGTIANSEWARIKSIVNNTSVTVETDLTNAQTGATLYDGAESYVCQLDLRSIMRLRMVVDGSVFTQAHAVQSIMSTV